MIHLCSSSIVTGILIDVYMGNRGVGEYQQG
jgi:hypothetical protein